MTNWLISVRALLYRRETRVLIQACMLAARAVKAARLDDELASNEHFTVFAPEGVDCFAVSKARAARVFALSASRLALRRDFPALI